MKGKIFSLGIFSIATTLLLPGIASAQGLVACTGKVGNECELCKFVETLDRIIDWLMGVLFILAVIAIIYAGLRLVTSGGNPEAKQKAKSILVTAIVGLIIFMAAWLIIDTGLKVLLKDDRYGMWNRIRCVPQPVASTQYLDFMNPTPGQSRGTASGLSAQQLSQMSPEQLAALAAQAGTYQQQLCAAATANGIADQCANLQALMQIESSSCQNLVSPAGAYGCMQILPSTARQYDPSLANLTDAEIAAKLQNDNAYSIALGTQIYTDAYNRYDGNTDMVYAAYNGGFGANAASVNCPGMLAWQCTWDGSDCINGVGSDCRVNTGYQETRNYVNNINALSTQIAGQ